MIEDVHGSKQWTKCCLIQVMMVDEGRIVQADKIGRVRVAPLREAAPSIGLTLFPTWKKNW